MAVGVEQHLGAHQGQGAGALGKPLVPADPDAQPAIGRVPDAKARVARVEVELLLVAGPVGDVGTCGTAPVPCRRRRSSPGCCSGAGVGPLEEAERQDHAEFAGQRGEARDHRMVVVGTGQRRRAPASGRGRSRASRTAPAAGWPGRRPPRRGGPGASARSRLAARSPATGHLGGGDGDLAGAWGGALGCGRNGSREVARSWHDVKRPRRRGARWPRRAPGGRGPPAPGFCRARKEVS